MPDHKNQHFVPRFTLDEEGKAINLYTSVQKRLIKNAPLKNQCARDYFYGANGQIEAGLAEIEGQYAEAVRHVVAGEETDDHLTDHHCVLIRHFDSGAAVLLRINGPDVISLGDKALGARSKGRG